VLLHEQPQQLARVGDDQYDYRNVHGTIDARPQLSQFDTQAELARQNQQQNG
jgi:hypothetical protein